MSLKNLMALSARFVAIAFLFLIGFNASAELTKKDVVDLLKSHSNRWQMAETLVAESGAKKMQADAAFRPKIAIQLRQVYAKFNPIQFGGSDNLDIERAAFGTTGLVADWTLLDPLASAKKAMAGADFETSKERLKQNQTDMIALALFQFLSVQRLQQQVAVLNTTLEKSQMILKLATTKKKVGAGIPLDVSKAQSLYSLDRLKKLTAVTRLLKARHELSESLGLESIDQTLEPLVAHRIPSDKLKEALQISLNARSDLKSADIGVEQSRKLLSQSQKLILPKLTFMGEIGTTQATPLGLPLRQTTGIVGLTLTIPLESGGEIAGLRAEALTMERRATLNARQVRIEALSKVKESLEQIVAAEEAMEAADGYLQTARDEEQISTLRFKQGASNIIDYMTSHGTLASAQDAGIDAVFNYEVARLNCYRAMGSFENYFEEEKQ